MLKFVQYKAPDTTLTRTVTADIKSMSLEGDWLSGVPTLENAYWFCENSINQLLTKNRKYAYHNELKVIREPASVYILIIGVVTEKKIKLCGFENIPNE